MRHCDQLSQGACHHMLACVLCHRPSPTGPKSIARKVRRMNTEHRWNDDHRGQLTRLNEILCLWHLVHHLSPMEWPQKELDLTPSRRHVTGDNR
jgi:hypothetical protein